MKQLSIGEKAKRYDLAIEKAEKIHNEHKAQPFDVMLKVFPELTESNDEKIKKALIDFFNRGAENGEQTNGVCDKDILAWLEKQGKILRQRADVIIANMLDDKIDGIQRELIEFAANAIEAPWLEIIKSADYYAQRIRNIIDEQDEQKPNEPNWCHHKVDLSNCSDEYRKAYFDGWNNCNMQYSQCELEKSDVLKCLIDGIKFYYEDDEEATWGGEKFSMKVKDILSWLEKQSQTFTKKDVDDAYLKGLCDAKQELEKQGEKTESIEVMTTGYWNVQDIDIKTEPKFHKGDWVIDKQGIVHQIANVIENVSNHTYAYDIVGGGYFNNNTEGVRLWTIKDAKDGDVLADDRAILLFRSIGNRSWKNVISYYAILETNLNNSFSISDDEEYWGKVEDCELNPASKEQCDLLFQKMKEAGYEWDAEKKELKKIEQNLTEFENSLRIIMEEAIECGDTHNLKADAEMLLRVAFKSAAWGIEDEQNLNAALGYIDDEYLRRWLKDIIVMSLLGAKRMKGI